MKINGCWICEPDAFSSQQQQLCKYTDLCLIWSEVDEENSSATTRKLQMVVKIDKSKDFECENQI